MDLTNYVIDFDCVLKEEKVVDAFLKHLKKELNSDSLEFIKDHERFLNLIDPMEKLDVAKRLFNTYIATTASTQVNLSSGSFRHINTQMNQLSKETDFNALFAPAIVNVLTSLKIDALPRFVRSASFESLLRKNPNLMKSIAILKPLFHLDTSSLTDDDFMRPVVQDTDFMLFDLLQTDSFNWKMIGSSDIKSKSRYNLLKLNTQLFPNVSAFKNTIMTKFQTTYDWNIVDIAKIILVAKNFQFYDSNVAGMELVRHYTHEELSTLFPEVEMREKRSCSVYIQHVKLSWPLSYYPKHMTVVTSVSYNPQNRVLMMIGKTLLPHANVKGSDPIINYYCIRFQSIDDNSVLYTLYGMLNLKGIAHKLLKPIILRKVT